MPKTRDVFGRSTDYVDAGPIVMTATTTNPIKGNIVIDKLLWKKIGQRIFARYSYRQSGSGNGGSGDYLFELPNGLQFDTSLITPYNGDIGGTGATSNYPDAYIGEGWIVNGVGARGSVSLHAYDATHFRVVSSDAYVGLQNFGSTHYNISGVANAFEFNVDAPILGWSEND